MIGPVARRVRVGPNARKSRNGCCSFLNGLSDPPPGCRSPCRPPAGRGQARDIACAAPIMNTEGHGPHGSSTCRAAGKPSRKDGVAAVGPAARASARDDGARGRSAAAQAIVLPDRHQWSVDTERVDAAGGRSRRETCVTWRIGKVFASTVSPAARVNDREVAVEIRLYLPEQDYVAGRHVNTFGLRHGNAFGATLSVAAGAQWAGNARSTSRRNTGTCVPTRSRRSSIRSPRTSTRRWARPGLARRADQASAVCPVCRCRSSISCSAKVARRPLRLGAAREDQLERRQVGQPVRAAEHRQLRGNRAARERRDGRPTMLSSPSRLGLS